jgi:hypothetical protein
VCQQSFPYAAVISELLKQNWQTEGRLQPAKEAEFYVFVYKYVKVENPYFLNT